MSAAHGQPAIAVTTGKLVGTPVRRREDPRLLTGQAQFVDDLHPAGLLHVAFLRSPHAHALIEAVDATPARAVPGVAAVVTSADIAALPLLTPPMDAPDCLVPGRPLLARDVVRFAGEAVAAVVATSRYAAEDGRDAIAVRYHALSAVGSLAAARAATVAVHAARPDNAYYRRTVESGDIAAAFAQADLVIERRFRHPRLAAVPLETRGTVAAYDAAAGALTLWASTQAPHTLRAAVARMLGLPLDQVRVVAAVVGGGFGLKTHIYPEDVLVAWLARHLGRPVKWVADRQEDFLAATHARETEVAMRAAVRRDGVLLGLEATVEGNVGAYAIYPQGPPLSAPGTAAMLPGPYRLRHYRATVVGYATHAPPDGAYRGVGQPVAALVHERLMDLIAQATGLDPADVRRRNLIRDDEFPYTSATGMVYESGQYHALLERTLAALDYAALRREQAALRRQGRYLGIGLACVVEFSAAGSANYRRRGVLAVPGYDAARLVLEPSGRVVVWTSLPAMGQGLETTFAQLVADGLGVSLEQVDVRQTDTAHAPLGSGCFGSRSAIVGGGALHHATAALRERLLAGAAELLEVSAADLELADGAVAVRGVPGKAVAYAEIARAAAAGGGPGLVAEGDFDPPAQTFPSACHAAVVEVDVATGQGYVVVEDCGPLINPTIVDGQVQGAVAQGLGGALYEEIVYDEHGQLHTGSLMDYLLPGAPEVPALEIDHLATPAPGVPGGFKGVGEGGVIGATPAVANAVADALAPLGVEPDELPLTPERLHRWLRAVPPLPHR
ncbi:MAG: xanthine dehydrogenase family protein [Chloroflexi bacterium]|nr:xanthine dehydrogenase family protein [Chloroflexota bacterium]